MKLSYLKLSYIILSYMAAVFHPYLHSLVPGDPGQLVHGQDVEALTENSSLYLDRFPVPCQAEGTLPTAVGPRDTSKPPQEFSS